MANALVEYITTSRLSCDTCLPAPVYLCVPSGIVAQKDCICCDDEAKTDYPFRFVQASLISKCQYPIRQQGCIVGYKYTYRFSYDSNDIVSGYSLDTHLIGGVLCEGCMTHVMEDLAGYDVKLVEDPPGTVTLTNQHGCTFTFQTGQVVLSVADTETINLTLTDGALTADLKISDDPSNAIVVKDDGVAVLVSSQPGNCIQLLSDGLFVSNNEECDMGCCSITPWVDFSDTAVITLPGTGTPTINEAKYKRANGVVFIKFSMSVTLAGTTGISVRLRPPVTGVPDDAQASYICGGQVNGVGESINWRYDLGTGDIIFFRDGAATITNGAFEAQLSDFYEEVA